MTWRWLSGKAKHYEHTPAFVTRWSGMAAVYLETNRMSTVDDPSGSVLVDVLPP
jgi:hypothetical protein